MARRLARPGVAVLSAYLVYIGGGWLGIYDPGLRTITLLLAAATLGTWGYLAWRRPEWRPRTVLSGAIVATIASLAISTLFSRNVRISAEYLAYALILVALYLLLVRLMANARLRGALVVVNAALFIGIALEFVLIVAFLWIRWWSTLGQLDLPPLRPNFIGLSYGNPSGVLTMVVLLAMPAAATWGRTRRQITAALMAIVAIVGVVALLSGSRAGWFALGITAIVGALGWLSSAERRAGVVRGFVPSGPVERGSRVLGIGVAAAATLLVVAGIALGPAILQRLGEGGEDLRATYAVVALRLFGQSPIVGVGPGMWTILRIGATRPPEIDYYIPHAHDVPVQTLAELGVVGALAGLIVLASVGALILRSIRSAEPARQRWAWVAGLGLVYFCLHNLLDFYVDVPAALFAAALPIAYLDAMAQRDLDDGRVAAPARPWSRRVPWVPGRIGRPLGIVATAAVAAALAGTLWLQYPASQQATATARANAGDWAGAEALAASAAQVDPGVAPYLMTAGLVADRAGNPAEAADLFRRVATTDDLPEAWLDLAAEQTALGDTAAGMASIERALRLGYQRPAIVVAAADLLMRSGQHQQGVDLLAGAIAQVPSLAGDPRFATAAATSDTIPLRGLTPADEVIKKAEAVASPDVRWEIALTSGDAARASQLAAQAGVGESVALRIIAAWTGIPGTLDQVVATCRSHPFDIVLLGWCARLEARAGNQAEANRYRSLADTVSVGASSLGHELRFSPDGSGIAGGQATFWALYTYRNDMPLDLLVPSLLHLELQ